MLIRSLLGGVEKLFGAKGLADVRAALPADVRAAIDPVILPVQWYPIHVTAEIQSAIRATVGKGSWEVSHKIGVEAAKADFSGPYRVILRAVGYDTIWERFERAWSAYNSHGRIEWEVREVGNARGYISGVTGFNPGIWHGVAGRAEGILFLSGARGVAATIKDPVSTSCRIEAMWFD